MGIVEAQVHPFFQISKLLDLNLVLNDFRLTWVKLYLSRYSLTCLLFLLILKMQGQSLRVNVSDCRSGAKLENVFFAKSGQLITKTQVSKGEYIIDNVSFGDTINILLYGYKDTIWVIDGPSHCLEMDSYNLHEVSVSPDSSYWNKVFESALNNSRKSYRKSYRTPRVYEFRDLISRNQREVFVLNARRIKLINFSNRNFLPVIKTFKCDSIYFNFCHDSLYANLRSNLSSFYLLRNFFIFPNFYFNELQSHDFGSLFFAPHLFSEKIIVLKSSFNDQGITAINSVKILKKENLILEFQRIYELSGKIHSAEILGLVKGKRLDGLTMKYQKVVAWGSLKLIDGSYVLEELKVSWQIELQDIDSKRLSFSGVSSIKLLEEFSPRDCDGPEILSFTTDLKMVD